MIAIDTEYNSKKEILSLGISSIDETLEYYFNNVVDSKTVKIHCLIQDFLKENHFLDIESLRKEILTHDYIIGFDVYSDLKVLDLKKAERLYSDFKVIDIKYIFNVLGFNCSLSSLSYLVDICGLPHSASYDSELTLKLYLYLEELSGMKDFKLNMAELTYHCLFGNDYERDEIISSILFLKEKIPKNIEIDNCQFKEKVIKLYDDYIHVLVGQVCLSRFPYKYFNKKISHEFSKDIPNIPFIKFDLTLLEEKYV